MKKTALIALVSFFISFGIADDKTSPIKSLGALTLTDHTGKKVNIGKEIGKPVLFVFWATWCDPCMMEIPILVKIQNKYRRHGLRIISVAMDGEEQKDALQDIIKCHSVNYPVFIATPEIDKIFGEIKSLPCSITLTKSGVLGERSQGILSEAEIEAKVKSLL